MEKERANEKKIGGQEEGRKKKSEGDQYFLLLSLLFLFRGLLLLFLGVFLIFFFSWNQGGGQGLPFRRKTFWVDTDGREAPQFVLSCAKEFQFVFCDWHVFESMTRDCNKYLKMKWEMVVGVRFTLWRDIRCCFFGNINFHLGFKAFKTCRLDYDGWWHLRHW